MLKVATDQTCQKQFLDKSSAHPEIRRCLSTHILLSVQNFSTYCTVFLKLRYRNIVAFRTKIEWLGGRSWSLTRCKLHISRCDVEKHCQIIFNALVVQ